MKMPELPDLPSFDDLKPDEEFMRSVIRGYALAYGEMVRDACAKVCEDLSDTVDLNPPDNLFQRGRMQGAWDCAEAIRGEEK